MIRQPLLQLALPQSGVKEFLVFESNRIAAESLALWPADLHRGLQRCAILCGDAGSGKSHLAEQWAQKHRATVVSGVLEGASIIGLSRAVSQATVPQNLVFDPFPTENLTDSLQRELFHLVNQVTANHGSLLLTHRQNPVEWDITLPDLRSRLLAMNLWRLGAAEDDLLRALTVQSFRELQIAVEPELIDYILNRAVRSPAALTSLVARLNEEGLRQGRAVTIHLAREVFSHAPAPSSGLADVR
ncbi:MAG: hypothetical protein ORO03_10580 [Alphaproteobacteria bacterium]|nr:hypothetical protein [Alphaproteobacteria bacterium]